MAHKLPTVEQIEDVLRRSPDGAGLRAREVADQLGVSSRDRAALRRQLREMVAAGRLVALRGRRFGSRDMLGDVVGRYSRHAAGFGFVVPDDPDAGDLFIPPGGQGGALHGDIVAAEVSEVRADGRREGRIRRVLERRSQSVVGLFQGTASGGGVVEPLDAGFGFEVLVPKDRTEGARTGEIVRVGLESFPFDGAPGRGGVVERLGRPDEPGVDVEVLIRKYGFETTYPKEVEREADALPDDPARWPLAGREDFTGDDVVTIDGETAKDFDDAICVTRREGGGYRLAVHIADVAFFVQEGSALDEEALRRGTSVYFPGRAVAMLPERLSNDLCSLRPDELRLTQGVTIDYDARGTVRGTRFHDGVIRSRARLTYTEVARIVEERDEQARAGRAELLPMLDAAAELAGLLERVRERRGAIDFDLPEPEVVLELTGTTSEIVARRRNLAHRMIEEFMIAANEAVATELKRRHEPTLYRAHERPDPERAARLAEILAGLGYRIPEPYHALEPSDLAGVVEQAKGRAEEPFVNRAVLRTMALARYDAECLGHYGLALARYLHFTSPIRRYPDLVAHRALRRLRHGPKETPGDRLDRAARLPELARECSRLEREAEAAEREALAWKVAAFMADRLGEEFDATIVDIAAHGLTVLLADPYVEGLVPVARLGREFFRYDARRRALRGSDSGRVFRLGQRLRVRVDRVDLFRHFVDFAPVAPTLETPGARPGRAARPAGRGKRGSARRDERSGKKRGPKQHGERPRGPRRGHR
ncbi:MAG: ribonuclease R [Acidobacteria bacterium]|nr:ribonuclease R [Acidobacteriota bacterium]